MHGWESSSKILKCHEEFIKGSKGSLFDVVVCWLFTVKWEFSDVLSLQIREYEWYRANSKSLKFNALLTTYEILLKDRVCKKSSSKFHHRTIRVQDKSKYKFVIDDCLFVCLFVCLFCFNLCSEVDKAVKANPDNSYSANIRNYQLVLLGGRWGSQTKEWWCSSV